MRGTRYGDFSRFPDRGTDGYDGILMQQGRVQLDADWNELSELPARRLRVALADLFGGSGAPAAAPGFEVRPRVGIVFDGSVRLSLNEPPERLPGGAEASTLEFWLSWGGRKGTLVDCRAGDGVTRYWLDIDATGAPILNLQAKGATAGSSTPVVLTATQPLEVKIPVHLAVVVAADYAAVYLDGLQVTRESHSGLSDLQGATVVLGGPIGDGAPQDGFVGVISGVRAWRARRTPAELASAAETGPAVEQDTSLAAAWTFTEAGGSVINDSVGERGARAISSAPPSWQLIDLTIGPGHFYVDGVLCDLARERLYSRQPSIAGAPLPTTGQYIAYLEAWEESISAVEDPTLSDVALAGLDTSVRTRLTSCVRLAEVHELPDAYDDRAIEAALDDALSTSGLATTGRLIAEHTGQSAPGNYLYRVEIHEDGHLADGTTGSAVATPPSFKWSRDNGASMFALAGTNDNDNVDVVGVLPASGGVEPLAPGDIVEPLRAGPSLDQPAHPLLYVKDIDEESGQIILSQPLPPGVAYLRRWDHGPSEGLAPDTQTTAQIRVESGWIALEDGIQVQFQPGRYRRGDYWWIVSRADSGGIDWPQDHGHASAMAPAGIERVTAPLALLSLADGRVDVEDVRRIVTAVVAERRRPPPRPEPEPAPEPEPETGILVGVLEEETNGEEELVVIEEEVALTKGDDVVVENEEIISILEERDGGEVVEEELEVEAGVTEPGEAEAAEWELIHVVDLPGDKLQDAVGIEGLIVVGTSSELFAVSTESDHVELLGELPAPCFDYVLCAIDDVFYVVAGGSEPEHPHGRVFRRPVKEHRWEERARHPIPRAHPAVAVARGRIHVLGGGSHRMLHRVHGEHHVYDPDDDRWTEAPPLPTHRARAAAKPLGERLHVVGGHGVGRAGKALTHHEVFDLDRRSWDREPDLPKAKHVVGSGVHHGRHVVLLDDEHHREPHEAAAFDAGERSWSELPRLPERLGHPVVATHDDRAHVLGAREGGGVAHYRLRHAERDRR